MQLHLSDPDLQRYVEEKIQAGAFPSAEAVVENALRNEMAAEELGGDDLAALEAAQAEIDQGRGVDFAEFAARLRKRHGIA